MNTQTSIIPGSISAIAQQSGKSIAETFSAAEVIIIVDTSGSMATNDSTGYKSRYDVACDELRKLQTSLPGKIAVLSFSDCVEFCPSGIPTYQGGRTALDKALNYAKIADVEGVRFILISDGMPDSEEAALNVAKKYKNKIDVIYVGSEQSPYGRAFLQKLAACTGGSSVTAEAAKELAASVTYLLSAG